MTAKQLMFLELIYIAFLKAIIIPLIDFFSYSLEIGLCGTLVEFLKALIVSRQPSKGTGECLRSIIPPVKLCRF